MDPWCTVQTCPKVQVELTVQNGGEGRRVIFLMLQRKRAQCRRLRAQPVEAWGSFDALGHFEMHIPFTRAKVLYGLCLDPFQSSIQAKKTGGVVGPRLKSIGPAFGLVF